MCNATGERVLAVMSVDGVNVVSGETASPAQSGYVLSAYECADINGWRTSLASTAAFYFTDAGRRLCRLARGALRTSASSASPSSANGRNASSLKDSPPKLAAGDRVRVETAPGQRRGQRGRGEPGEQRAASRAARPPHRPRTAPAPMAKIGTGYGRQEQSYVRDDTLRARERDAERDAGDQLRPSRESHRDGHPATASDRPVRQSVSRVEPAVRAGTAHALR